MQWGTETSSPTLTINHLVASISGQTHSAASSEEPPTGTAVTTNEALAFIDLPGVSRATLGKHWTRLKPLEQDEFIALFAQLLIHVAFPQLSTFFRQLEVTITDERIRGHKATVTTYLKHAKEGQIDIDYHLVRQDSGWLIRDIELDGVSLSRNLRAQFQQIIRNDSYAALLRRMREKLVLATMRTAS